VDIRDMLSEADVMKSLQPHPHIVRLIGYCIEKGKHTCRSFLLQCRIRNLTGRCDKKLVAAVKITRSIYPRNKNLIAIHSSTEKHIYVA